LNAAGENRVAYCICFRHSFPTNQETLGSHIQPRKVATYPPGLSGSLPLCPTIPRILRDPAHSCSIERQPAHSCSIERSIPPNLSFPLPHPHPAQRSPPSPLFHQSDNPSSLRSLKFSTNYFIPPTHPPSLPPPLSYAAARDSKQCRIPLQGDAKYLSQSLSPSLSQSLPLSLSLSLSLSR
jgi:hypothetical protein